jgi:hypothetical protein
MEIEEPSKEVKTQDPSSETNEKKFIIKKWHAVTLWTWGRIELF